MYLSAVTAQSLYRDLPPCRLPARRDGFARLDGAQVRHVQVLDLVPLGYPSADLNHLVAKRWGELGSQVSPDDDLDVARLILSP